MISVKETWQRLSVLRRAWQQTLNEVGPVTDRRGGAGALGGSRPVHSLLMAFTVAAVNGVLPGVRDPVCTALFTGPAQSHDVHENSSFRKQSSHFS